ncbi:MAG: gliding motility-associated C-terminal domain-containing protein [Daejeonella sp.]
MKRFLLVYALLACASVKLWAQQGVSASGGEATGAGGNVSYSVGQIDYSAVSSAGGSITEGLQQPRTALGVLSDINLSANPLFENQLAVSSAGVFSSVSNDPNAIFTYSLVSGAGSADNALFQVSGNQLLTTQSLNFENKSQYSVRVRSTAQFGSLDKIFLISISDVNEQPTLNAIADQSLCSTTGIQTINLSGITPGPESGQSSLLSVSSDNPALFKTLSIGAVLNGAANLTYELEPGTIGTANITVAIKDNGGTANGGMDELNRSFKLTINALPAGVIMSNKGNSISKGETITLVASGGETYSWADGNGIIGSQNTATLTARPNQTTTYQVLVNNASGCSSVQTITIEVRQDYQALRAANLLTPNGDGINDTWLVENIDVYPDAEVKIFNVFYQQIFSQKAYDNTWTGIDKENRPVPEGTYYYVIDFGPGSGQLKGFITLLRDR